MYVKLDNMTKYLHLLHAFIVHHLIIWQFCMIATFCDCNLKVK